MTRQEKINKVAQFCAKMDCTDCEACEACERVGYGSRIWRWSAAAEDALDVVIAAMGDTDDIHDAPTANDPVNHPSHYTAGGIECIDAIESMFQPYPDSIDAALSFLIAKYLWRHPFEDAPVQDLKKARFYLDRLIGYIERGEEAGNG